MATSSRIRAADAAFSAVNRFYSLARGPFWASGEDVTSAHFARAATFRWSSQTRVSA